MHGPLTLDQLDIYERLYNAAIRGGMRARKAHAVTWRMVWRG